MRLIIGGSSQGKLGWYLSQSGGKMEDVADGNTIPLNEIPEKNIISNLHRWILRLIEGGKAPEDIIEKYLEAHPDAVIICDEVGCGVVPIKPNEREWREATGRICCMLAKKASRVDRVFCGLPMTLKEEQQCR